MCVSVSVCFFALVACFWTVSGDESYIHGERLAGCILEKGGGGGGGSGGRGEEVQVGGSGEGIWWSGQ